MPPETDNRREGRDAFGLALSGIDPYLASIEQSDASSGRWERLRTGQPAALRFWFRQSPVDLAPADSTTPVIQYEDPPFTVTGSIGVWLDTKGRLLRFDAVPPEHEPATPQQAGHAATNWSIPFEVAGLAIESFRPVPPEWSPVAYADERRAWQGVYPEAEDAPIRVEAAAFAGRLVSFRIIEPWTKPADVPDTSQTFTRSVTSFVEIVLPILILIGGALLAVRNIRLGRSDRRGAFRLAAYLLVIGMLAWVFMQSHFTGATSSRVFFGHLSWSLYRFVVVWIFYVAIEPYLRRLWPRTMISWARALDGRWRDPLVGRDCLLGTVAAGAMWLVLSGWPLVSGWVGVPALASPIGHDANGVVPLAGPLTGLSLMLFLHAGALFNGGLRLVMLLVLLRLLTRRTWIAVAVWLPLIVGLNIGGDAKRIIFFAFGLMWLAIFFRLGVLSLMVALGLTGLQITVPATLSTSVWYAVPSWIFLVILAAVASYGFIVSLGGGRAFGKILAEQ